MTSLLRRTSSSLCLYVVLLERLGAAKSCWTLARPSELLMLSGSLASQPSQSLKGQFGPKGALFDGWESRRHNPSYDWYGPLPRLRPRSHELIDMGDPKG